VALDDEFLAAVLDRIEDLRPAAGCFSRRDPAGHQRDNIRKSDFVGGRLARLADIQAAQVTFGS
jgi:hypothetical protein